MKAKLILVSVSFLTLLLACTKMQLAPEKKYIAKLSGETIDIDVFERQLIESMEKHKIPGLSLGIINNGKLVYHTTKGFADLDKQQTVTDETIFEGASLSKPVFGFLVMTFVEQGILDLDRPLHQYLPNPDISYDDRYKKITARMVLSHQTGFPNWRSDYPEKKLFIQFEPGTDHFYSGEGYQYLAKVLAHLANTDSRGLEKVFVNKIAKPLNMFDTQFIPDDKIINRKAVPYKNMSPLDFSKPNKEFGSAYSIHTNAVDMSKWLIGLMDRKVLSEVSYQQWLSPQGIKIPVDDPARQYGWADWALGFAYYRIPDEVYFHGGNNYGYTSIMGVQLDKKWGMVLFTNADQANEFTIDVMLSLK